jgi:hypothetical protein
MTDGTPFTGQTDTTGYQIAIDATPAVSIPIGYATTFDMSTLAVWPTLKTGQHSVQLAVVTKEGVTGLFGTATFPILGVPVAPTALVVS